MSSIQLLKQKRFLPFFVTQFLGAFNDNLYKNALIVMLTFYSGQFTTLSTGVLVSLCGGIFILPYFLFSATAGQFADKFEKSRLIRATKMLEIIVMIIAAIGFYNQSLTWMLIALFLLGTQSTIFGPVKYAILPQALHPDELVGGNAMVESGTFIAILIGTLAGGLLVALPDGAHIVATVGIGIAVVGWFTSVGVPQTNIADPNLKINWNPVTETVRNLRFLKSNRAVFLSVLGISWAWFYGAIFLSQLPLFVKDILRGDELTISLLLTVFSIGIGVGSFLCERLSGKQVELGLVPLSSIGLTWFAFDMWWGNYDWAAATPQTLNMLIYQSHFWRILFDLFAIGLFGGLFMVPLYTMMQTRSEESSRSRVIAGNNILNALFMVIAAMMAAGMVHVGFSVPDIFLVTAILTIGVSIYLYKLLPEFLMRFLVVMFVRSVYRLKIKGLENIPQEGPAIVICNHVSFVDPLIIMAASRRPIRFVMHYAIYKLPILNFIFKENRAIPIAEAKEDLSVMRDAYEDIVQALEEGDLVGIFPEGGLTSNGEIQPFKGGITKILARKPVSVVPMALKGLWGSFFSRKDGPAMSKPFRRGIFSKIELVIDPPMAPVGLTPRILREKVTELRGDGV